MESTPAVEQSLQPSEGQLMQSTDAGVQGSAGHQCPKCSRIFNRASALASHLNIHEIVGNNVRTHSTKIHNERSAMSAEYKVRVKVEPAAPVVVTVTVAPPPPSSVPLAPSSSAPQTCDEMMSAIPLQLMFRVPLEMTLTNISMVYSERGEGYEPTHLCPLCPSVHRNTGDLIYHFKIRHNTTHTEESLPKYVYFDWNTKTFTRIHVCNHCTFFAKFTDQLWSHLLTHTVQDLSLAIKHEGVFVSPLLEYGRLSIGEDECCIQCTTCGEELTNIQGLNTHIQGHHYRLDRDALTVKSFKLFHNEISSIRKRKSKLCECVRKSSVRNSLDHMRHCPAFQQEGASCPDDDIVAGSGGLYRCPLCPYYHINKCCAVKHKNIHHKIMRKSLNLPRGDDQSDSESSDEECAHHVSSVKPSQSAADNLHLCGHCGVSFASQSAINQHMLSDHAGQLDTWETEGAPIYECKYCSRSFKQLALLQSHCQSHLEGSLVCEVCGKSYKNAKSLQGHVKKVHMKEQYPCTQCADSFNSAQSLTLHVRKTHTKVKPCVCQHCGESFYMMYSLKNHERSRHADLNLYPKILCDLCGYEAKSRRAYMRHRQYQHAKEFGIQATRMCDICGKVVSKRKFYQHKQMVHSTDYRYLCEFEGCEKKFNNSKSLRTHRRIHDPSQWFHCTMCPQVFTHRASVHRHMKTHSGDKPYHCEICNLSFAQGCSLTRHKRVHSGDAPYSCRACGMRFKQQSLVVTHYNRLSHRSCRDFIQRLGLTPNVASQLSNPLIKNTQLVDQSQSNDV